MRRMKILRITSELFRALLIQDGAEALKTEGIPRDVRLDGMWYDNDVDAISVRLESDEFPEVREGHCLERFQPTLTAIRHDVIEREAIAAWLRGMGHAELAGQVLVGEHHRTVEELAARPPVESEARRGREFL